MPEAEPEAKGMNVYSASRTESSVEKMARMAEKSGQNNFLLSFFDKAAQQFARHFCKQPHHKMIIDSGAFSAWTKRKPLEVGDYIKFCKEIISIAKCPVLFISLDEIAGAKDESSRPDPEEFEKACEKSWTNYEKLRDAGIPAIPTFHQYDDFKWLYRMAGEADYIAVSTRKDGSGQDFKTEWLEQVFAGIGFDKKVHGLGVCKSETMENFPFHSVDNTVWLNASKGIFRYFDGRRARPIQQDEWRNPRKGKVYEWDDGTDAITEAQKYYRPSGGNYHFMTRALEADAKLQGFLTMLWGERGFPGGEVVPHHHSTNTTCHLCISASLYADFRRARDYRKVAERRGMDPKYVGWAVHLAAQTALWQKYRRGEIFPQALADRLWHTMWDGQYDFFVQDEWEADQAGLASKS
jgi:hypothetical protein